MLSKIHQAVAERPKTTGCDDDSTSTELRESAVVVLADISNLEREVVCLCIVLHIVNVALVEDLASDTAGHIIDKIHSCLQGKIIRWVRLQDEIQVIQAIRTLICVLFRAIGKGRCIKTRSTERVTGPCVSLFQGILILQCPQLSCRGEERELPVGEESSTSITTRGVRGIVSISLGGRLSRIENSKAKTRVLEFSGGGKPSRAHADNNNIKDMLHGVIERET
ncbi:hypothetical protein N7455_012622 [Penicillium solitum]|uniref:uncharacterized protein n=1 Tax=Penicillium solitum TaxID=60172 RepID=UPI0032C47348|nr:hypothetical protein N7455_012622 [Penicillium solitum]